ncbi:MAG: ribonuclease HII [Xanthomonadales bacterium]|nr:ribonuclease HII [Xanthomonadales bacterium]
MTDTGHRASDPGDELAGRAGGSGEDLVAGVDEAGRGPLAGPVTVAAVILHPRRTIAGLADSKVLTPARRERLALAIHAEALAWAVVEVEPEEIDRCNILAATLAGMERALRALPVAPAMALIDGNRLPPGLPCAARAIVGGDRSEPAVSAASILAKVHRDRRMVELDDRHPGYGFAVNKGYPTADHLGALARLGPCPVHRRSFAPVRACLVQALPLPP